MTSNLGYPIFEPPKWYGLWCPTLDCFLFVHFDLDLLLEIQLLASSKILTVPVNLDIELAKNNILDNTCCTNWTVVDPEKVNFTFVYQKPDQIWTVEIQESQLRDIDEAREVQSWFMFLLDWIYWIKNNVVINNRVRNFINYVLELSEPDFKQKIYKILLLSETQQKADIQIKQLIYDYKL